MIPLTISQISEVISGKIVGNGNKLITGSAFFDSREIVSNGIFLALKGEHVDGHDFAINALEGGAGVIICTRGNNKVSCIRETEDFWNESYCHNWFSWQNHH
jgi:UDP-N-acetylmuramoyl-tripeptide--D-alanyl-D-alanine ligase